MQSLDDLLSIRKSFAEELESLDRPVPGVLWQYSHWVITMQTLIEIDRIIREWRPKNARDVPGQVKNKF